MTEKKQQNKDFPFWFTPPHITSREDLTLQEKVIFGVIVGLSKQEGYCYASNQTIGDTVGLSDSMVSKHISKLAKMGLVSLKIAKIKKGERTGIAGEKYGTIRHIYIYQLPDMEHPSTIDGAPPSTIDGEYIVKNKRKEGEGLAMDEPTPPLPSLGKGYRHKTLPLVDQLEILVYSVMGIYPRIDIDALLERAKKFTKGKDTLLTCHQWLNKDILMGEKLSNYYNDFMDLLPEDFEEAEKRIERQLLLPAYDVQLEGGQIVKTPGIPKAQPQRMNELKEKLEKLEKVTTKKYDL
jgi:DNA-binding transcriptional ArsR family regulator